MNNFSSNLKKQIKEQDINKLDMSEDLHISDKTLYSYMSGTTQPRIDMLISIADYLYMTVDELVR